MAIPSIPYQFFCQSANGQILVTWALSVGATSYIVERSEDRITFVLIAAISGSPLATDYLDTTATPGVQYWYRVAAVSTDGTSPYTPIESEVATQTGEMSLGQLRLSAQQRADRVNSEAVSIPEWNKFINLAYQELDDLLITTYEDYRLADPIILRTDGTSATYTLPTGFNSFLDTNGQTIIPPAFYKLMGVDLQTQAANNGFISLRKFNFIERNKYLYPNTNNTLYGPFHMQYRIMGNNIQFIPIPSGAQTVKLWYVSRLPLLLRDTDSTTDGVNGWIQYVIVRAAKYALDKEESPTEKLDQELLFLQKRIEAAASNRDIGQPDTISNIRNRNDYWGGSGDEGGMW